jgi:hypothetical protein
MATTPQSVFPIGPLLRETKNKWGRDKHLPQAGPDVKQILSFLKESRTGTIRLRFGTVGGRIFIVRSDCLPPFAQKAREEWATPCVVVQVSVE